jgi:Spy/CpxP family protein refolding chaperone
MSNDASVTRKAALWVGVVFLLGAALGGMLGYVFAHHTTMAASPQLTDTQKRAQKVQKLTEELSLTPDQQRQIDAILTAVQAQAKAIRQSTDPQMDAARQKGREQIRAVLLPEQKPKFEEFLRRIDEERKLHPPQ